MFGELKDFPVTDLLPVLSGRNGVLSVNIANCESKLYIKGDMITHLEAEHLPYSDAWSARQQLYKILGHRREGSFSYIVLPIEKIPSTVQWPIDWILLNAISQSDILEEYSDILPDPETIFVITGQDPIDLNHDLRMRLQKIAPLLDGKRSAQTIAHMLGSEGIEILYTLARLRILGYVRPARRCLEPVDPLVNQQATKISSAPISNRNAHKATHGSPLLQRLAGFLRLGVS